VIVVCMCCAVYCVCCVVYCVCVCVVYCVCYVVYCRLVCLSFCMVSRKIYLTLKYSKGEFCMLFSSACAKLWENMGVS
jgi:hypothetical protein